jgi:hypothetical protein
MKTQDSATPFEAIDSAEAMLHRALDLLQATQQRLDEIEARFGSLEAKLEPAEPETAYQVEAAKLLKRSPRTLQRWRETGPLKQGLHWWPDALSSAPIYNLRLIRDGQRQGFDSPAHHRACQRWLKEQPSNTKSRNRS